MTNSQTLTLQHFTEYMLPAIEKEMQACVRITKQTGLEELHHMMAYHLGWEGQGSGLKAQGKRVRPMLVLLTTAAVGGDWETALPAAAAVELVHNFSLIHDDIQDDSPLRRGRETVWKKWQIPQAINAGDSMFALAHIALHRLEGLVPTETALKAQQILPKACLVLTQGQYLDLSYEDRQDLSVEDYWPMIKGKTASLIATCTELGALIAGADEEKQAAYYKFGEYVGLAFQAYDDILGIWGNADETGKSTDSDLLAGKKSLPVLYGLQQNGDFAKKWNAGNIKVEDVGPLTELLEAEGAYDYTKEIAEDLTNSSLESLHALHPEEPAAGALEELVKRLITRSA